MVVTHIREKCPLLAHERKTPNQRYSGQGSQHPETFNSTRQHPPKLQPSVNNCLCIQVKTEKIFHGYVRYCPVRVLSSSVHHSVLRTPGLALLPQLTARVYSVDSLCESEVISDRLRSRSPPLSLARSLAEFLIQEHPFESSRAELCETCLCGLHNNTSFVFTQTLPSPSVASPLIISD